MDFVGSGLGQAWIWFLPPKFSWNAVFDCGQLVSFFACVCDLYFCLKSLYFGSVNECCLANSNSSFDLQLTWRCFRRPLSHLREKCLISMLNYMEFLKI